MELTEGSLLGGRVRYAQPRHGFRSGIEPVLLAAAIPARSGELVIEGGCGAGAGLLCLAARVSGVRGIGVERDPVIADVARRNVDSNGFAGIAIQEADLTALTFPPADHAFANPPYHCCPGTIPSDHGRRLAKHAASGVVTAWIRALAAPLRHRGTLTIVLPPAVIPEALNALEASRCAAACMFPLWPGSGRAAKLILLQGVREGRGKLRLDPGLTLHTADGGFTQEANSVLRDNASLELRAITREAPCSLLREVASPPSRFDQGLKEATTTGSPR